MARAATKLFDDPAQYLENIFDSFVVEVPDIIEFVVSDKYLNRSLLYPRQATLLKTIFLQDDLFTDYDYDVLEEWASSSFHLPPEPPQEGLYTYQGDHGIVPDVLERITLNKKEGRKWFREVVMVAGRRASKGHLGGLCGAYVLWNYMATINPQEFYGLDRDKRLTAFVFAGKKEQAKVNQWRDLNNIIMGAPCFGPFISRSLGESLTVTAPNDRSRMQEREAAAIKAGRPSSEDDMASFEIVPKEATLIGGRGPASFMQYYDEMAHIVATGANRSAEDVYDSATPALDQFGKDAFLYEASSPWQMLGQFYTNWQRALEVDPVTRQAVYPDMLTVQLESWDIYDDWQRAHTIPLTSGHKAVINGIERTPITGYFNRLRGAIQSFDAQMERLEKANPETFAVERRAKWATVMDAYLHPENIAKMFEPWGERAFVQQYQGILAVDYVAHGDPSTANAGFGFAIGHREGPDENGFYHVVFDVVHAWLPSEFPNHQIDYIAVESDLKGYLDRFMPSSLTFDQFSSAATIQHLQQYVRSKHMPKRIQIYERTATAPLNWRMAETFKAALNTGLLHAPYHELADLELRFLQDLGNKKVDHPSSGPVQTKDVADAMFAVTHILIGHQMEAYLSQSLSDMTPSASLQGGIENFPNSQPDNSVHEALSSLTRGRGVSNGGMGLARRRTPGRMGMGRRGRV